MHFALRYQYSVPGLSKQQARTQHTTGAYYEGHRLHRPGDACAPKSPATRWLSRYPKGCDCSSRSGKLAPKKKATKKKKKDDGLEPPHEPSWERTVETGIWERAVTDLPDANTWPTWGALRERVLTACKEIRILNTASLRDAFCNELVRLSPSELWNLQLAGSSNLRNFVLSPNTACPRLTDLNLSESANLGYVLIQSSSLRTIKLNKCPKLSKVLIHCPHVTSLTLTECPALETVMIWSDELTSLDLTGCDNMLTLKLQCPALTEHSIPPLKFIEQHIKPSHPPIAGVLKETYAELARSKADAKEKEYKSLKDDSIIPRAYRQL